MFSLRRPTDSRIEAFLAQRRDAQFTYVAVGATAGEWPRGFICDEYTWPIGRGTETFERAANAIRQWKMYPTDFVALYPANPPVAKGTLVAPVVRLLGVWALVACRIAYVCDERDTDGRRQYGFAYGTVVGHAARGEEMFRVEYDPADDSVVYRLKAFSRPAHLFAYLAFPMVRRMQRRFAARSCAALRAAIDTYGVESTPLATARNAPVRTDS